jgi:carbamoyl-phosphate synthase large subunit
MMMGRKLKDANLSEKKIPHFGVKEAVFPFTMFPEVDPLLGPEMRSTGEVLGLDRTFGLAYFKAEMAAQQTLPARGTVLISVANRDKQAALKVAKAFHELGFRIRATRGTQKFLADNNIPSDAINKQTEGRPNIVDGIMNKEIQLVINTPAGKESKTDDSYLRKAAIKYRVPYITTIPAALAAAQGIADRSRQPTRVRSLQEYHKDIG